MQGFTGLLGSKLNACPQIRSQSKASLQRRGISVRAAAEAKEHTNGMGGSVSVLDNMSNTFQSAFR